MYRRWQWFTLSPNVSGYSIFLSTGARRDCGKARSLHSPRQEVQNTLCYRKPFLTIFVAGCWLLALGFTNGRSRWFLLIFTRPKIFGVCFSSVYFSRSGHIRVVNKLGPHTTVTHHHTHKTAFLHLCMCIVRGGIDHARRLQRKECVTSREEELVTASTSGRLFFRRRMMHDFRVFACGCVVEHEQDNVRAFNEVVPKNVGRIRSDALRGGYRGFSLTA